MLPGQALHLPSNFPAEYQQDFQTVSQRGIEPSPSAPTSSPPLNIIVLVMESVGTRHLGIYGSHYPTTPTLEAEAGNEIIFQNIYSPVQNSANALVALTLSMYTGITWREMTVDQPAVPGVSLAQKLHDRGYRTAFYSAADNAFANQSGFLRNRGYDTVADYHSLPSGYALKSWGTEDRLLIDGMLQWIDRDPAKPFFLFGWTIQSHDPYFLAPGQEKIDFFQGDPPPNHERLGRYLNTLHNLDHQIGRLFDALRTRRPGRSNARRPDRRSRRILWPAPQHLWTRRPGV